MLQINIWDVLHFTFQNSLPENIFNAEFFNFSDSWKQKVFHSPDWDTPLSSGCF